MKTITIKNSCGGQGCEVKEYMKRLGYDDTSKNTKVTFGKPR